MANFFKYRGIRIKAFHQTIFRKYFWSMMVPFLIGMGFFVWFYLVPPIQVMIAQKRFDGMLVLTPSLLLLVQLLGSLILVFIIRKLSKDKGGFFGRVWQRQMLAKMLVSKNLVERKIVKKTNGSNRETIKLPAVYYKKKGLTTELTFPTDGRNYHDHFMKIGQTIEEMFLADLIEEEKEIGFTKYTFLIDVKGNRITIDDVVVTGTTLTLMKGVVWDFAETPHLLITGGTGGGKTYLLYTLIKAFMEIGTVDICDPKRADLMDLGELPAFKGHVFTGTEWITRCLKNAVKEMDKRYDYMKSLPNYVTGKNYAYYSIPPHFVVVDEWVAFYSTLDFKEEEEIRKLVQQLVLKARQAGVFLILAMQRPDAQYLGGGIRDNMMYRISVGKLTESGYHMTFGDDNKNKAFVNKSIRGRGYVSDGSSVPTEFYSPLVPKTYDFMHEFGKINKMITIDYGI